GTSQKTSGFDASTITEKVYSKVFYNKDGNIYSVVDLTLMDGAKNVPDNTLVLSEYNSSSQKLTRFKNQGSDVTLKDKDYIVFKDGVEVDPEDLEKFDTLFVFNANCGMDFVVCAVTPQTRTVSTYYTGTGGKLEIAFSGISGRQLVVTDGAVSGRTQYSANDGNFNETTPKAVDDYIKGNEGTFAWDRKGNLKYIIVGAVTEATTTVTGVVKSYVTIWDSYTPSLRVGYSSVTIYALDGSSATYSFKDGEDYYDEYGDLMIGDAVQFKVDTNNMITAPDGTFIMAPAATKPVGNEYTVTNGSVAIDGTTYALGSAVILNINWKTPGNRNSGIDSVNVVERSKLGSSFETGEIQYMTTSSTSTTLKYLVLEDFGSSSGSKYAVVSSAGEASRYVYFYGNSARQDAGTAGIGPWYGTEDWLVKYRLDAGKVVWEANVLDLDSPGTDVGIITDITEGSKEGTFIWDDKGTDKNVRFDEDTQILIFNKDLEWVELEDQFLSDFEEDGKAYVVLDGSYAKLIVIITG
ncbi:MAG: hypothetical protein FWF85_03400, partial [Clostridiales bacterium]|nr:hypothetical protein [Clostridiales bacterium]